MALIVLKDIYLTWISLLLDQREPVVSTSIHRSYFLHLFFLLFSLTASSECGDLSWHTPPTEPSTGGAEHSNYLPCVLLFLLICPRIPFPSFGITLLTHISPVILYNTILFLLCCFSARYSPISISTFHFPSLILALHTHFSCSIYTGGDIHMHIIRQSDSFITAEIHGSSSRKHCLQVCWQLVTSARGKRGR